MSDDGRLRNIVADHCLLLDQKQYRAYADLFAVTGKLFMSGVEVAQGPDAIHSWITVHEMPPGNHLTGNIRIDVEGDHATGQSSVMYVTADKTILFVGRYEMRFVKLRGDWKIAEWRAGISSF